MRRARGGRGGAAARRARAAFLVSALPALAWSACTHPAPPEAGVLRLALRADPARIDPARVVDAGGGMVCALVYQGLVRLTPEGRIVPDLARTWTVSPDGRRYRFVLDASARFSTGEPVRASDVAWSFRRVLDPHALSPRRWVLERIRGARAFAAGRSDSITGLVVLDDTTLVVELDEPFAPLLALLAMPAARVVPRGTPAPRRAPGLAPAPPPPGSGPWRLAWRRRGERLRLEPNPYASRPVRRLRALDVRVIPEAFTRVAAFESGALDVIDVPPMEVERLRREAARTGARLVTRDALRVVYVGLNTEHPPLDDVRVRRALNLAVDVERLVAVLERGQATPAAGAVPPPLAGYRPRPPCPFRPDSARALLRAAGLSDGFDLDVWLRDSPAGRRVVEAIQGYLAGVGVRVRLVRREWGAFKQAVTAGTAPAFFLDWLADYPDAENFLYPLFHSDNVGGGGNRARLRDARLDALIERAARTVDASRRAALWARADSLAASLAPWIYLYHPRRTTAIASRVRGYAPPVVYLGQDFTGVRLVDDRTPEPARGVRAHRRRAGGD